jgi:hypothetical protein
LFSEVKRGTKTEVVCELVAEENIWTEEGLSGRRVEKTA